MTSLLATLSLAFSPIADQNSQCRVCDITPRPGETCCGATNAPFNENGVNMVIDTCPDGSACCKCGVRGHELLHACPHRDACPHREQAAA